MADQATGAVETGGADAAASASPAPAAYQHLEHNSGRKISWTGVFIAIIGAIVGGVWGFIPHMNWMGFWVGFAIMIVGLLVLAAAKTFNEDWY